MAERDAMAATGIDTELVARRDAEGTRTMGGALVAALMASAEERGVEVVAGCGVEDLADADGWWTLAGAAAPSPAPSFSPPAGSSGTRGCRRRSCPTR